MKLVIVYFSVISDGVSIHGARGLASCGMVLLVRGAFS